MDTLETTQLTAAGTTRQDGVALITALLVVSLAVVAAVAMATRQHVDVRRTGNLLHGEQAYAYALAAESWAKVILLQDAADSNYDSLEEDWATALPPIAVDGGLVNGRIEDLQGRFNVNNLMGDGSQPSETDLEYFKRLLENLDLNAELAAALLDWMDADFEVIYPGGAEDEVYLLLVPPYRAANRPLVSISELRLVKGFTPEVIARLAPHITALPERTAINANTATPEVLQALHEEMTTADVEALITDRGEEGYTVKSVLLEHAAFAGLELKMAVDITSDWFRVLTDVTVGGGRARLESLLVRKDNSIKVVSRVRGLHQIQVL
ncbi:MAG: type II secretion system minor pseudopilin GspK [Gammaproteobacteria bacterium]